MKVTLAQCPRCKRLFAKIRCAVCETCVVEEEQDFEKIRELLDYEGTMNAEQLAEAAEVSIDVVLRMLDAGNISCQDLLMKVTCGRCGRPAISRSKRLCQNCLNKLEAEFLRTVRDARIALRLRGAGYAQGVHNIVQSKLRRPNKKSA